MGYHIPNSPRSSQSIGTTFSATQQASMQTETAASAGSTAAPASGVPVRRRNAIVGALYVDAMGSPRSPAICLAQDRRMALAQQRERQHAQELAAHDRIAAPKPRLSVLSGA